MRLPDPFTPNLKVETLPDISHAPSVIATYLDNISRNIKSMMEECIDDTGKLQQFQVVLMEELQVGSVAVAFSAPTDLLGDLFCVVLADTR